MTYGFRDDYDLNEFARCEWEEDQWAEDILLERLDRDDVLPGVDQHLRLADALDRAYTERAAA
jgi:hypothetical protein